MRLLAAVALLAVTTAANAAEPVVAISPQAQRALLASDDPQLAANKKLVWDMWRNFLQAGRIDDADKYLAPEYHQHNPNAETGLAGVKAYFRAQNRNRPRRRTPSIAWCRSSQSAISSSSRWCVKAKTRTAIRTRRPGSTCSESPTARSWSTGTRLRNRKPAPSPAQVAPRCRAGTRGLAQAQGKKSIVAVCPATTFAFCAAVKTTSVVAFSTGSSASHVSAAVYCAGVAAVPPLNAPAA